MAMIVSISGFVVTVLCAALARQLADDFKEWTPWITDKLVKIAVSNLPLAQRDRFGEEWRSHLNEIPGCIAKLLAAMGLPFAARQIASDGMTGLVEPLARRALEMCFSAGMLFCCAPLLAIMALAIRIESSGSIFHRNRVLGQNGTNFDLFTFRTVDTNGRTTRIGRLLRKFDLDYVPMLFNVSRGDLALVGPRPHLTFEAEHLAQFNPKYSERMKVRPGLFSALPEKTDFPRFPENRLHSELDCDLEYVKNRSLLMDLRIIWSTIRTLMRS